MIFISKVLRMVSLRGLKGIRRLSCRAAAGKRSMVWPEGGRVGGPGIWVLDKPGCATSPKSDRYSAEDFRHQMIGSDQHFQKTVLLHEEWNME